MQKLIKHQQLPIIFYYSDKIATNTTPVKQLRCIVFKWFTTRNTVIWIKKIWKYKHQHHHNNSIH